MHADQITSWVVYQTPIRHLPGVVNAICDQQEWEAMELARPGYHTLVRAGIENEGAAEQLARSTPPPAAG